MNAALLCVFSPLSCLKFAVGGGGGEKSFDVTVLSVCVPTFRLLNWLTDFE